MSEHPHDSPCIEQNAVAIPRAEWDSFLDRFSKQHAGWLVRVTCRTPDDKIQEVVLEGRLKAIRVDEAGNQGGTILVEFASPTGDKLVQRQPNVEQICLLQADLQAPAERVHRGLGLVAKREAETRVMFRSPAAPETVDGVMNTEGFQE